MAATSFKLDAHQQPPHQLKALFKKYQKAAEEDLKSDPAVIDLLDTSSATSSAEVSCVGAISSTELLRAIELLSEDAEVCGLHDVTGIESLGDAPVYQVRAIPGLLMIPSMLSTILQIKFLDRLLHRDLADPHHKTNLHLHYNVPLDESNIASRTCDNLPWKRSLFGADPASVFRPKDPLVHQEVSLKRVLEKKLRWVTLGGQYNWTTKEYPPERPPPFPRDIARTLKSFFPRIEPQAAILNFYSPGDTLSVHRDVSEQCDHGLISLSFGCEAIFVAGNEDGTKTAVLRIRSGDALLMSSPSRFAWHGVPKVLAGTCPEYLRDWPMIGDKGTAYQQWKGWMAGKRINLNVRQMREDGIAEGDTMRLPE